LRLMLSLNHGNALLCLYYAAGGNPALASGTPCCLASASATDQRRDGSKVGSKWALPDRNAHFGRNVAFIEIKKNLKESDCFKSIRRRFAKVTGAILILFLNALREV